MSDGRNYEVVVRLTYSNGNTQDAYRVIFASSPDEAASLALQNTGNRSDIVDKEVISIR